MWLLIPILIYTLIYLYIRHIYSYWERKGFPTERSGLTWQFMKQVYKREFQHVAAICEAYSARKEPLYGIYHFFRPTLLVRDVSLARQLLENSNGHFANNKWDYVRGYRRFNLLERLAPIFNAGRVDGMFRGIEKVADCMVQHLRQTIANKDDASVDMQHVSRIYALNVISTLVYGADFNHFVEGNNIFNSYLQTYLSKYSVSSYTLSRFPKHSSLTYRLRDLLRENIEEREEGGKIRKDVLQLLAKFRNGNDLNKKDPLNWHVDNVFVREKVVSISLLSKVAEEFLNMSLDTIASVIIFTLYEVLREPGVLQKIFDELRTIPEQDSVSLSYDVIENLKYLDLCVQETLRKHPAVPIIERVCRKSYNIPESKFVVGEGKVIIIPLLAIQHDEKYFPEAAKYKPARFLVNGQHNKTACMSYGLGVGTCVAKHFANTVIKVALVKIFQNFQMCLSDAEQAEICYNPAPFIKSRFGLNVKLKAQEIKTKFYL